MLLSFPGAQEARFIDKSSLAEIPRLRFGRAMSATRYVEQWGAIVSGALYGGDPVTEEAVADDSVVIWGGLSIQLGSFLVRQETDSD